MITPLLAVTITIRTPDKTTDEYGNSISDWSRVSEWVGKGWFSRSATSHDFMGRDADITEGIATLPLDAPITTDSRVVINERAYEVVGETNVTRTPLAAHHIEVRLERVEG